MGLVLNYIRQAEEAEAIARLISFAPDREKLLAAARECRRLAGLTPLRVGAPPATRPR